MRTAVAVFVKTPGITPVKTRLAKSIGHKLANEFYDLCIQCLRVLMREISLGENSIHPIWAVAEKSGNSHHLWSDFDIIIQGNGNLGDRLNSVYSRLIKSYDSVILLGSDSPQLSAITIIDTASILCKDTSFVVGPAIDGGFYLFGGRFPLPESFWTTIPFSVSTTINKLRKNMEVFGNWEELPEQLDVDIVTDLWKILPEMKKSDSEVQQKLGSWIESLGDQILPPEFLTKNYNKTVEMQINTRISKKIPMSISACTDGYE